MDTRSGRPSRTGPRRRVIYKQPLHSKGSFDPVGTNRFRPLGPETLTQRLNPKSKRQNKTKEVSKDLFKTTF